MAYSLANKAANKKDIGYGKSSANRTKIKQQRKAALLTQFQLSALAAINKTTISEVENGRFTGSFLIFWKGYWMLLTSQFDIITKEHSLPDWDRY
ncbi:transcriptional regulator [Vibrio sp. PP-XX7]